MREKHVEVRIKVDYEKTPTAQQVVKDINAIVWQYRFEGNFVDAQLEDNSLYIIIGETYNQGRY